MELEKNNQLPLQDVMAETRREKDFLVVVSAIELTTSRTEALQTRRSFASSLETFTQSFPHRARPKTRGPEIGSKSALIVVTHIFSWPPARLRRVGGGVGSRRPFSSPSGRLAA